MSDAIHIKNKRATFEYTLFDTYICGMVLTGTEIKSIRASKVSLAEAYCHFVRDELYVTHMHIAEYILGTCNNHEPKRDRKLLLTKRELKKIHTKVKEKGVTLIPTRLFVNEKGLAKLEIATAQGKKLYDKRESIKEKDMQRDLDRYNT